MEPKGKRARTEGNKAKEVATVLGLYTRVVEASSSPKKTFVRKSVQKADVQRMGLTGSSEYHRLDSSDLRDPGGRAILCNCEGHYRELHRHFPEHEEFDKEASESALFGENLIIRGQAWTNDTICIGDRFVCESSSGNSRNVEFIVTSPRRPCSSVDHKHLKRHRGGGVRDVCGANSLAGFFCRINIRSNSSDPRESAMIEKGDVLRRISNPHPKWTLRATATAIYGGWSAVDYKLWYRLPGFKLANPPASDGQLAELTALEDLVWDGRSP